jgi:hypothetical protein
MALTFSFAVLKLIPDALRGEAVNLGIVVFRESEVDIRVGEVLTRAKLLYPDLSSEMIRDGVSALKRLGASELPPQLRYELMRDSGLLKLGELGYFTADGTEMYEQKAVELLKVFTASGRRSARKERAGSKLVSVVRKAFRDEKLLSPVGDAAAINEHKIVPEWPLPMRPSLKASLALKNGLLRVCEVADLAFEDEGAPPKLLFESAVTLDVAHRDANAGERVFAYRAVGSTRRIDEALAIIGPYTSSMVNWDDELARRRFVEEWTEAARS